MPASSADTLPDEPRTPASWPPPQPSTNDPRARARSSRPRTAGSCALRRPAPAAAADRRSRRAPARRRAAGSTRSAAGVTAEVVVHGDRDHIDRIGERRDDAARQPRARSPSTQPPSARCRFAATRVACADDDGTAADRRSPTDGRQCLTGGPARHGAAGRSGRSDRNDRRRARSPAGTATVAGAPSAPTSWSSSSATTGTQRQHPGQAPGHGHRVEVVSGRPLRDRDGTASSPSGCERSRRSAAGDIRFGSARRHRGQPAGRRGRRSAALATAATGRDASRVSGADTDREHRAVWPERRPRRRHSALPGSAPTWSRPVRRPSVGATRRISRPRDP